MYFEIDNTPEHIKKARRSKRIHQEKPDEELPRLILAPFSRPPQVVFDNVLIGSTCERYLEVYNPSKQAQQITLGKALPAGLIIQLPEDCLEVEPETCYCLTMLWTPYQPTATRETIRFTNEDRGRYDIIIVLKSVMNIKGKTNPPKSFKISPGKMKKKSLKKSPVNIYKKKTDVLYNSSKIKKNFNVVQTSHHRVFISKDSAQHNELSNEPYKVKSCPFDSSSSIELNFNTSEIFSSVRKPDILQDTYDKPNMINEKSDIPQNVLKTSNKIDLNASNTDIFDNLNFTPLKSLPSKSEKLEKGPKIVLSLNYENNFNDFDISTCNKENETHSIISITSTHTNKWLTVNHHNQYDTQFSETPTIPHKKHPNTSSPKEVNSPNFSINTEFSRISDLSFFPQRFSTERKILTKLSHDTYDDIEDKILCSDTYTKDSPNTPMECNQMYTEKRPPHFLNRELHPKVCRQALFKEYQHPRDINEKKSINSYDCNIIPNFFNQGCVRAENKSPPRSITPPLQSIPEESVQFSDTQTFDKSEKHLATFTINRTFDKNNCESPALANYKATWSKKAVRAEPDLWKIPMAVVRKTMKAKPLLKKKDPLINVKPVNTTIKSNKSLNQNISFNQVGNIYSQSFTTDPFSSTTYFYDEEAVDKFEIEFKRWLNYILTPPADLDSNVEQKIDVGKAWIENRNKEIPLAPTKEQVCNMYHNSHRLESLRRSARALLKSCDIAQVIQKLHNQIEKKLIAIRTDRNLHLDIGLQKAIMELLLSYNPLWLRVGLEAIYGLIIPLKSNSDIEGLTTFIIHRMFKNPYLKSKNSKLSAPNVLLPAYMEAIKKFTLKKFFMLVFFLDQAKQRKLIPHDPCLFCRNSVCKESREIIIRFTRELIAGIGDITKHLRPIGYVVSHKQSYLDEYKYAVHNIAVDIRDGVRLTKVMEIILMKNGLLNQLRTPAISRLQKIHNVQVALNALKESNFIIVGDISATDIADGHREKTLSLLWQIIHVFRAPLFDKAANVIQTWWRKKYEVILTKKMEKERILQQQNNAASVIQCWWRRIQYNRYVESKMHEILTSTIIIQKYCRMWLLRTHFLKKKRSVLRIEKWYKSVKQIKEAKKTLANLKLKRELLRQNSATIIQSCVRGWLCRKLYLSTVKKVILLQAWVRMYISRKRYIQLKKSVICVQERYRGKLSTRLQLKSLALKRQSAIKIQSYYRMIKPRRNYRKLKTAVSTIENRYLALIKIRQERKYYLELKKSAIAIQSLFRGKLCFMEYRRKRNLILKLQARFRAYLLMKQQKENYLRIQKSASVLQKYVKPYLIMKKMRDNFTKKRNSAIKIQKYFRSYLIGKAQRQFYLKLRRAAIILQLSYRSLQLMRHQRLAFLNLKNAAIIIQRRYRAQIEMKKCRASYINHRRAASIVQMRYRALKTMQDQRKTYLNMKAAALSIQHTYKAYKLGKSDRQNFLKLKESTVKIQNWFRNCKVGRECKKEFEHSKLACVTIQRIFRAIIISKKQRQEYLRIRTATICIQKYYRSYVEMKSIRQHFVELRTSTVIIQRFYKSYITTKKQRDSYLRLKSAAVIIQNYYRHYRNCKNIRNKYLELRKTVIYIQNRYRSLCAMKLKKEEYQRLRRSVCIIQERYRALCVMRTDRQAYLTLRSSVVTIQTRFKARQLMKVERSKYLTVVKACITIQRYYRAHVIGKHIRNEYLILKRSTILVQRRYRSIIKMQKERALYLELRKATVVIQLRYRSHCLMIQERSKYLRKMNACIAIQRWFRANLIGKQQRREYLRLKSAVISIQKWYKNAKESQRLRNEYFRLRSTTVYIQRRYRRNMFLRTIRQNKAATKIQKWYISIQNQRKLNSAALTIQLAYRRKKINDANKVRRRAAAICIQKNIRRYLIQSWYKNYVKKIIYVQKTWRGILMTRKLRCEFLQKRKIIIKFQSILRGYLVRKQIQLKKKELLRIHEENKRNLAVSKIQALYRGHKVRQTVGQDKRLVELRRRWRDGALVSFQKTMRERHEAAMDVLNFMGDIEEVIRSFKSLELLTEVFPMLYNDTASSIVSRLYDFMLSTNRSISSVEILKSGAAILVNLTRYKITGPSIYSRDRISPILKFMWRFSNTEVQLFCKLCTLLWLFSKYDEIREDLTKFLHTPENHKILLTIKSNIGRMKRMTRNFMKGKYNTPQPARFVSRTMNQSLNVTVSSVSSSNITLPALEPDYGIIRVDESRYFEDAQQAIDCLFHTYKL